METNKHTAHLVVREADQTRTVTIDTLPFTIGRQADSNFLFNAASERSYDSAGLRRDTQRPERLRMLWELASSMRKSSRQNLFLCWCRVSSSNSETVQIASKHLLQKPLSDSATKESPRSLFERLR